MTGEHNPIAYIGAIIFFVGVLAIFGSIFYAIFHAVNESDMPIGVGVFVGGIFAGVFGLVLCWLFNGTKE